ncbi:hypothetical protein HMN09_00408900 [Mycena chlorophos]|uniref:Clavaminate synthase-like protein n=1 Tax=Mycena chlorophos TaxID=658473 RepID=A0A8H6WJ31_MYCCL|nr:hypothetical protein HMN09_00408900 [Mycena chlorophos]
MTTVYLPPPGPPPQLYAPPPGPPPAAAYHPPSIPPPQTASELSGYIRRNLTTLAAQGWLALPLPPDLEALYSALFDSSAEYFALPADAEEKTRFAAPSGAAASDEGYADIPEEKQLITLRRQSGMPPTLKETSNIAWNATGKMFLDTVHNIAECLELEGDLGLFDEMSAESNGFAEKERAASLLRLFRYNRPMEGKEKRVVAEAHKDLGLLTLVVGSSPGLDAKDVHSRQWVSVEDGGRPGKLTATLLAGQTMSYLTRNLFTAGPHRVSVLPPADDNDPHRFSIVFALRPAPNARISTDRFARSPLVGPFPPELLSYDKNNYPQCSMRDQPAKELSRCIAKLHWNVNIAPEVRNKQRQGLRSEVVAEEPQEARFG